MTRLYCLLGICVVVCLILTGVLWIGRQRLVVRNKPNMASRFELINLTSVRDYLNTLNQHNQTHPDHPRYPTRRLLQFTRTALDNLNKLPQQYQRWNRELARLSVVISGVWIPYAQTNPWTRLGRYYAQYPSYVSMLRQERRVACFSSIPLYYDLDMVNAWPTILLHEAQRIRFKAPLLTRYVHHREECLDIVIHHFSTTRSVAKMFFLMALFGANVHGFAATAQLSWNGRPPWFMSRFVTEMKKLVPAIVSWYRAHPFFGPRMTAHTGRETWYDESPNGMSIRPKTQLAKDLYLILSHIEMTLIMDVVNYLVWRHGRYTDSIVYDGIHVRKTLDELLSPPRPMDPAILNDISDYVWRTHHYRIALTEKTWEQEQTRPSHGSRATRELFQQVLERLNQTL